MPRLKLEHTQDCFPINFFRFPRLQCTRKLIEPDIPIPALQVSSVTLNCRQRLWKQECRYKSGQIARDRTHLRLCLPRREGLVLESQGIRDDDLMLLKLC